MFSCAMVPSVLMVSLPTLASLVPVCSKTTYLPDLSLIVSEKVEWE